MKKKNFALIVLVLTASPAIARESAPVLRSDGAIELDQVATEQVARHLDLGTQSSKDLEMVSEHQSADCVTDEEAPAERVVPKIRWFDRINPIWWVGNADDPKAPDWYRPGEKMRNVLWYFRNPFHNFTFYVLGVADKVDKPGFRRCGKFPKDVFAPTPGWNYATIKYKGLRLPFVSYWNKNVKFYLGWRERGNIGGKLNISKDGKYGN